jgi:hypothetical protein
VLTFISSSCSFLVFVRFSILSLSSLLSIKAITFKDLDSRFSVISSLLVEFDTLENAYDFIQSAPGLKISSRLDCIVSFCSLQSCSMLV